MKIGNNVKKVPVVIQMESVECGAASLCMILAYHGKWLPLEEVRTACGVSRDGSSAKSILRAARGYGLEATGYRVEPEALEGMQPCIIHWNFEHFVVFRGFKKNKACLNDPATGPVEIPMEEFERSFTGIALEFSPTEKFQKGGSRTSIFKYVKMHLRGAMSAFWLTMVFGLLTACVSIAVPMFTRIFADEILSGRNRDWQTIFLISMSVLAVFNFFVVILHELYSKRIAGILAMKGNIGFLRHLLSLPMTFFAMRYVGDLQQRRNLNETITNSLVTVLAPQVINVAMLILYLILMLSYNVTLTLIGIIAVVVNILSLQYYAEKRVNLVRSQQRSMAQYYNATVSCIDNMESIKAAGAEAGFFEYWSGLWSKKFNIESTAMVQTLKMGLLPTLVLTLVNSTVLIIGAYNILCGEMTIGMLLAFQGFMASFMTPVNAVVTASQKLIEMRSEMESVEDVMKCPSDKRGDDGMMAEGKLGGELELRHVTFGYNPLMPPLIEDFNLHLMPGKSVAFVGSSGCGKSTLAKLISGLYKPWSGEILFDGRPIETISQEEMTNSVAVVDQNVVLFDDTVAQNIKMWDQSIEDFTMMMACNDAQIRKDIINRPEGFSTRLIKGGQNFSGGQRQRMEIATALAKEPVILIMDEATSALDPTTEEHVMESIRIMGATQVIVAHRLSTIRDCDEIIVMDQGKIMQRGTHDELIAQEGMYKELMKSI
ncbi:MAG: NHLP family bacteriocin export ABC transporter peptidase/permease/ATPase subunit [Prevotella sp.]